LQASNHSEKYPHPSPSACIGIKINGNVWSCLSEISGISGISYRGVEKCQQQQTGQTKMASTAQASDIATKYQTGSSGIRIKHIHRRVGMLSATNDIIFITKHRGSHRRLKHRASSIFLVSGERSR